MSSKSQRKVGRPRKYLTDKERWCASQQARRERLRLETQQANKTPAIFSSKSYEWYTPSDFIARVLQFLEIDEFHCDPASPRIDGPVPAKIRYTIREDGLSQPWMGKVWLNPPFMAANWVCGSRKPLRKFRWVERRWSVSLSPGERTPAGGTR